jgi:hypothetical protein
VRLTTTRGVSARLQVEKCSGTCMVLFGYIALHEREGETMEPTSDEMVQGIAEGMHRYLNSTLGAEAKSLLYMGIQLAVQEWLESHQLEIIHAIAVYAQQD